MPRQVLERGRTLARIMLMLPAEISSPPGAVSHRDFRHQSKMPRDELYAPHRRPAGRATVGRAPTLPRRKHRGLTMAALSFGISCAPMHWVALYDSMSPLKVEGCQCVVLMASWSRSIIQLHCPRIGRGIRIQRQYSFDGFAVFKIGECNDRGRS